MELKAIVELINAYAARGFAPDPARADLRVVLPSQPRPYPYESPRCVTAHDPAGERGGAEVPDGGRTRDNRAMAARRNPIAPLPPAGEVLRARYAGRLPERLEDLAGPAAGRVELPLHVAWSGLRTYDLGKPRLRMSLYRTVLAEGQRDDVVALLDRDLLIAQWPVLRSLVSRHVRQAWEEAFPRLADAARPASAA